MQKVLQFEPIYKKLVWGGSKLKTLLGRNIPSENIGESWEISDYGNDISIIKNGNWKGMSLRECYTKYPDLFFDFDYELKKGFPLLIKLIDARDKLSVQVHPDADYVLKHDPKSSEKKESWLILQSDPKASIYCGFSKSSSRSSYLKKINSLRAEEDLQKYFTKPGDAFLIKPGTLHSIGAGNFLLEVQQSSDSTYRVYDYGRPGLDGKPRELHLEKALSVINYNSSSQKDLLAYREIPCNFGKRFLLTHNQAFFLDFIETGTEFAASQLSDKTGFLVLHIIEGEISIPEEGLFFKKGDTFLLTNEAIKSNLLIKPEKEVKFALAGMGRRE